MRDQPDPVRLIVQLGAIALLWATVAVSVGSLRGLSGAIERSFLAVDQASARDRELLRCRTIAAQQLAADDACRQAWAENRRHFLQLDQEKDKPSPADNPATLSQSLSDRADSILPSDHKE